MLFSTFFFFLHVYIYLFICCCCFKGLGFVVPEVNRITGSNLQCHEVCFAQTRHAIGYTAHQRHRPHVNSDMEHVIQERKPHTLRLAFIHPARTHPYAHRSDNSLRWASLFDWFWKEAGSFSEYYRINLRRTWSCRDSPLMFYMNAFKVFKVNLPKFRFSSDVLAQNIFFKLVLVITVKNPMWL